MKFDFFHEHVPRRLLCEVAAAVLGAGALSAGASIWGANKAANAQTSAANAGIQNQREMYETNKAVLAPYINAGVGGLDNLKEWINPTSGNNVLSSLIRLVTPGADMTDTLRSTPGYQFQENQGTRAIMNRLASRGLGGSAGAVARGIGQYVTGLADSTWGNVVDKTRSVFDTGYNALSGLVNTGLTAGGALAGIGTKTADAISSGLTGMGNAQAAGYNAIGAGIGNFGNSLLTAGLINGGIGGGGGSVYGGSSYGPMSVGGAPLDGYSSYNPYYGPGY